MTIYIIVKDTKRGHLTHNFMLSVLTGGDVFATESEAIEAMKSFQSDPHLGERNTYYIVSRHLTLPNTKKP